ncbi:hypothetical protein [Lacipirellula limnantheis]|uniref:Transmembrane protein n=1 Tax=Lacipirellula limnantheis TaxID=2528024 RepID=A0A517TX65_9BACT|nr:hypothetical protein [Lacipirellula limnantheis]QDT72960.1 hypothetical protein I41_21470 [Lacipirellula limnantheis]
MDRPITPAVANRSHMLTYLRYALATVCLAASVGCLALWGWSYTYFYQAILGIPFKVERVCLTASYGNFDVIAEEPGSHFPFKQRWLFTTKHNDSIDRFCDMGMARRAGFDWGLVGGYGPLWYPVLVFGLSGVGVLRLNRFTLRSAIIATTVVAGLLGVAVGMRNDLAAVRMRRMLAYYLEFGPIETAVVLVLGAIAAAILVKLKRNV